MAPVEISAVIHPCHDKDDDPVLGAHLDYPCPGPVDGHAFEVNGWVVGSAPVRTVEFVQDRRVVARCVPSVPRPDAKKKYGGSAPAGFWKAIGTVGFAPDFTLWVRVVFTDGRQGTIAEIRGRQRLAPTATPTLRPLMLSSLGRSGSTWLMRMLAEHPHILVHERHPYETRVCGYWMHFLKVLAEPVELSAPPQPFDFYTNQLSVAQFPYYFANPIRHAVPPEQAAIDRWYGNDQVQRLARFAQESVESFYLEYAAARNRRDTVFFAEKSAPASHCTWLTWQLYPRARELFLIRDPRDILASALAFNHKRGFDSFGRERVATDEEYVEVVAADVRSLARKWQNRAQRATLVRYEDLVRAPHRELRTLLAVLELDSSADIVDTMVRGGAVQTAAVTRHRTTPDGPASIGRWATDLPPRLRELCDHVLSGLIDEFILRTERPG